MSDDEIEIIRSEEEFQRQNKLIGSLQMENKRLNQVEKQLQKEIEQLHLKLKNTESEKSIKQIELRNWKAQLESNFKRSEMQNLQYEMTLKDIQKKADKQRTYIQQLEQQLQEYKNAKEKDKLIHDLKQQTHSLSQQILEKEEANRIQIEQMKIQIEEAKKQIELESLNSLQLQEQYQLIQNENNQQKEKYQILINENEAIGKEKENLQYQLEQMQLEIQNLSIQIGLTESEYQETKIQTKKIIEELHQQQQEKLIQQQKKIEEINYEINQKNLILDELKIEKKTIEQKLKEFEIKKLSYIQIEEDNHNLQQKLQSEEENNTKLKNQIQQLEQKGIKQQLEIQNLKKKILELDKKQISYLKEKQNFIQTLGECQIQIDESQIYKKKQDNLIQRLQYELLEKEKDKNNLLDHNKLLQEQINEAKNSNLQLNTIVQNYSQMNSQIQFQNPKQNYQVNYKKEAELYKKQLDEIKTWSKTQINELQQALDEIYNQNIEKTLSMFYKLICNKLEVQIERYQLKNCFDHFFKNLELELEYKQIKLKHYFDDD